MKYAKHLQNVSKEYEILVTKQQRIHLRTSILTWVSALEPVRGRPGDHPGLGTLKITKKSLLGTLLWEHICDICWYFCRYLLLHEFETSLLQSFAPTGTHKAQFWRLWATKFGTDWANLEKWKDWFRVRGSIKIKPQGGIYLYWFCHFHVHMFQTCVFCDSRPFCITFF